MKKFISAIALFVLLGGALFPMVASAQTGCTVRHGFSAGDVDCTAGPCDFGTVEGTTITGDDPPGCSACCVFDLILTVSDWVFFAVIALAIMFVAIGAFNFVTAAGDPAKVLQARTFLIYAAIGIIIALLAKALPGILLGFVGVTT